MAKLLISLPKRGEASHELRGTEITIGRLPGNTIQIDDASVSAHHARLIAINGHYRVKDLDSTNKTYVNGLPVGEADLYGSCILRFGTVECIFRDESAAAAAQEAAAAQNHEVQAQIEALMKARDALHQQNRELQTERNQLREKLEVAEIEQEKSAASLEEEKKKLKAISSELAELRAKDDFFEREKSKWDARDAERNKALAESEQERAAAKRLVDELTAKWKEAQGRIETLTRESADRSEAASGLLRERASLQERLDQVTAEAQELREKNRFFEREHERRAAREEEREKTFGASLSEREAAVRIAGERSESLKRAEERIESLIRNLDAVRAEQKQAEIAASEAVARAATAVAAQKESEDSQRQLASQLGKLEAELAKERAIHAAEPAEAGMSPEVAARFARAREKIEKVSAERDAIRHEHEALSGKISRLEKQIQMLSAEKDAPPRAAEPRQISAPAKPAKSVPNAKITAVRGVNEEKSAEVAAIREKVTAMRVSLGYFVRHQKDGALLQKLHSQVTELKKSAGKPAKMPIHPLAAALENLLGDLVKIPEQITPGSLRTINQAVDFMGYLLDERLLLKLSGLPPAQVLAVDDDRGALQMIEGALRLVDFQVTGIDQPGEALDRLRKKEFDLILLDVGFPEMNGMDLCARIREMPGYESTPIIFLTGMASSENRAQSTLSGGNDFIGKPFNPFELAIKALIWRLKGDLAEA